MYLAILGCMKLIITRVVEIALCGHLAIYYGIYRASNFESEFFFLSPASVWNVSTAGWQIVIMVLLVWSYELVFLAEDRGNRMIKELHVPYMKPKRGF